MKNPFVAGSWVRGGQFFGRSAQLHEVLQGPRRFVWVMGTRRIGKTSFLKQLEYMTLRPESPENRYLAIFWDLAGSRDQDGLRESLLDGIDGAENRLQEFGLHTEDFEDHDVFGMLRILKRKVKATDKKLLLLCDECEELLNVEKRNPEVLPKLRRVFQEGEVVHSVLTATKRLSLLESTRTTDTSPFLHGFVPPIYLTRLADSEAEALIQQGGFEAAAVAEIKQKTDNHPYLIQLVSKRLFDTGELSSVIEEISIDDMVSKFFSVDYAYLSPKEKDVVVQVAQGLSNQELEAREGMTGSQMEALLYGLEQMGYICNRHSHYAIPNYFFEKWLRRELGVEDRQVMNGSDELAGQSHSASIATLELVERARAGDQDAFQGLRMRYRSAMQRWVDARTPHAIRGRLEIDSCIERALEELLATKESQHEGEIWEYLRQRILEKIQQMESQLPAAIVVEEGSARNEGSACPVEEVLGRETLSRYERSLARLGPEHRQAVLMRIEMGCSYDEIGAALQKPSSGAARMAVCRGLVGLACDVSRAAPFDTDNPRWIQLARTIADGTHTDWNVAMAEVKNADEQHLLADLQDVARIAWFHRSQQQAAEIVPERNSKSSLPRSEPHGASEDKSAASVSHHRPDASSCGKRWGHLELVEKIGEGVFGDVFRALDTTLDREVALKLLRIQVGVQLPGNDRLVQQLLGEARNLARVRHTNVVTIFGAEQYEGRVGIWMEYIRGKTLEQILQVQGAFGGREAALIGIDLCRALTAVHRAGIIHRDVKANNVMREEGGRILLMDFGTGAERDPSDIVPLHPLAGTPVYLAPEIFRGESATVRSDVYSLGVLLYRLVTGDIPVDAGSIEDFALKHESGEVTLLREVSSDLPEQFIQVVERALSPAPEDRYPTTGQMEQALVGALL